MMVLVHHSLASPTTGRTLSQGAQRGFWCKAPTHPKQEGCCGCGFARALMPPHDDAMHEPCGCWCVEQLPHTMHMTIWGDQSDTL